MKFILCKRCFFNASAQILSEKLISAHANRAVYAGDLAVVRVDGVMTTDANAPFAIQAFREMGGKKVWDANPVSLVLDHASPAVVAASALPGEITNPIDWGANNG